MPLIEGRLYRKIDKSLLLAVFVLMAFSLAAIYAATSVRGGGMGQALRQGIYFAVGLGVCALVASRDYANLPRYVPYLYAINIGLLIAVELFSPEVKGAARWIKLPIPGMDFKLQPSEFAKVFLILYLAKCLAQRPRIAHQPLTAGLWSLVIVPVATILAVEKEPDLGTAITLFGAALLMLFTGGVKKRWIAAALAGAFLAGLFLSLAKGTDNYRWKRIETFLNPDADVKGAGWQVKRGTIALGTGGITGLGLGESREKFPGNLPAQRTDFVFAILGEEFGFVGTTITITLLFGLIARGYHIAGRSKDPFGSLLATGITSIIAVQAFENMAVVTGVIPATGIPLPFLSYGGSSLVATLGSIGVLLNISQHPFRRDPREMARELRRVADESEARASASLPAPGANAWRSPVSGRHGMVVGPEVRN